jgi:hypothetical protein
MRRVILLGSFAAVICGALVAGCGGEVPAAGPPVFEIEPGAVLTSASGLVSVSVWTSPAPPTKGLNAVRFRVVDAGGAPLDGAGVSATVWMPAHGHGTSVKPSVTERGDGVYDVERVVFFMDGHWEVRSTFTDGAGAVDGFVATFDVR